MVGMPGRMVMLAMLLAVPLGSVFARDEFPLAGTYMQNRPCHGDGTDAKPLLVTITPDQIKYRGGTCVMNGKRVDGDALSTRVTCKSNNGSILSGEISFTLRPDKSLVMVDQDQNYHAVLNRCPQ